MKIISKIVTREVFWIGGAGGFRKWGNTCQWD
jgi:hypothetical protein